MLNRMACNTVLLKNLPRIILIFSILSIYTLIHAQNLIDSLVIELNQAEENEAKVLLYKEISKQYFNLDLDTAIKYGKEGLILATEIDYEEGIADLNNNLGIFYRFKGEYELAINHFFESLRIKQKNNDHEGVASTSNNIGGLYEEMEDPDQALSY